MNTRQETHGFTLIELLVVISIIALLTSVVLSSLTVSRQKAQNSAIQSSVGQWLNALALYQADYGGYYEDLSFSTICLGGTGSCYKSNGNPGGFPQEDPVFNTRMNSYIAGTPNPNSSFIRTGPTTEFRANYIGTGCLSGRCSSAQIQWYLHGDTSCAYGAIKTVSGGNTVCALVI